MHGAIVMQNGFKCHLWIRMQIRHVTTISDVAWIRADRWDSRGHLNWDAEKYDNICIAPQSVATNRIGRDRAVHASRQLKTNCIRVTMGKMKNMRRLEMRNRMHVDRQGMFGVVQKIINTNSTSTIKWLSGTELSAKVYMLSVDVRIWVQQNGLFQTKRLLPLLSKKRPSSLVPC